MPHARTGSSQSDLFPLSAKMTIEVDPNHKYKQLANRLNWTALIALVATLRAGKMRSPAGRTPHLRANIGAQILIAMNNYTYREAEDQIRYYAPARYLCGLTETDWTLDFTTMQDFAQMLGEDGLRTINEFVVKEAHGLGLTDTKLVCADTTAQEGAIPYPNEMGLMGSFLNSLGRGCRRAGSKLKAFVEKAKGKFQKAKEKIRGQRLFAKGKEAKSKMIKEVAGIVQSVQKGLSRALAAAEAQKGKLCGYRRVAHEKVKQLHETMKTLLPQIQYWLRTGKVATKKIISIHIPQLYSIVRGKVGKKVEFGLKWGVTRLQGGYLLAAMGRKAKEMVDTRYVLDSVKKVRELFGKVPCAFGYDRGGYSEENIEALAALGVRDIGLAPRGRKKWEVEGRAREKLIKERAHVEGSIGSVKNPRYGFTKPRARSVEMMGMCGQRAVFGFNMNKLIKDMMTREGLLMVG